MDDATLVAAYYRFQATQGDDDAWAWDVVNVYGFDRPLDKWAQLLVLLEAAPDDFQVGLMGAGPLEDLFRLHRTTVEGLVAGEVEGNQRLRSALAHVWLDSSPVSETELGLRRLLGLFEDTSP